MGAYSTLRYEVADGILTITLDRPGRLNAFTIEMADELEAAFHRASADDEVRAVVVTGAGRAFCAGMDLSVGGNVFGLDTSRAPSLAELRGGVDTPEMRAGIRDTGGRVALAIFDCSKPVIGAINGNAVGVGATMTLAMDARLVAENAGLGFVFGRLGITPEACSTWFLSRLVGISTALEWCYVADIIGADELLAAGLVRSVYAPADLLPAAVALAHRFTDGRSAVGVAMTRQMIYRNAALGHPLEAHLIESLSMLATSQADGREGVEAFLAKRAPRFTAKVSSDMPAVSQEWR